MFRPTAHLLQETIPPTLTAKNNPFRAKKRWPPDFTKLDRRAQFVYERKYRRRSKFKYQPEGWMRGTRVVQIVGTVALTAYFTLFFQWDVGEGEPQPEPFRKIREIVFNPFESVWSTSTPSRQPEKELDELPPRKDGLGRKAPIKW